jgi:aryl-alcohol dehydrogenase-like predicted oxidoreductase
VRGGFTVLDRHHYARACEASLRRLGTEYIDLYQPHWPDRTTPVEAQLEAVERLIEQGKVRYFGLSNETAWGATRFCAAAGRRGAARPVSVQNAYNLLQRGVEHALIEACAEEDLGLIAFSPLAMGVLTGKYARGDRPGAARLSRFDRYGEMYLTEAMLATADRYVAVAREHGLEPVAMAYAWVRQQPQVATVLSSCSRPQQLQPFLDSAGVRLGPEVLAALDEVRQAHDMRWNQFG